MNPITLTVYGVAQPKGSARAFMARGRPIITSDNPNAKVWEASVKSEAFVLAKRVGHDPFAGPVAVSVTFFFQRPKRVTSRRRPFPSVRPDLDKCVRSTGDALSGVLWRDDAQVIGIGALKLYTDGPAKAVITVRQILTPEELAAFAGRPYEVSQ